MCEQSFEFVLLMHRWEQFFWAGGSGGMELLNWVCTGSSLGIILYCMYSHTECGLHSVCALLLKHKLFCEAQETKKIKEYFGKQIDKLSSVIALQGFCQQGFLINQEHARDIGTLFKASLAF